MNAHVADDRFNVDPWLLTAATGLLIFGTIMVSSASISLAAGSMGAPNFFPEPPPGGARHRLRRRAGRREDSLRGLVSAQWTVPAGCLRAVGVGIHSRSWTHGQRQYAVAGSGTAEPAAVGPGQALPDGVPVQLRGSPPRARAYDQLGVHCSLGHRGTGLRTAAGGTGLRRGRRARRDLPGDPVRRWGAAAALRPLSRDRGCQHGLLGHVLRTTGSSV